MRYNKDFALKLAVGTIDYREIVVPSLKIVFDGWDFVRGKTVVDIGCGSGRYSRLFAQLGARVTGIDRNSEQLELALTKEKENALGIDYIKADVLRTDCTVTKYDIALLMYVLLDTYRTEAVERLISFAFNTLKPQGVLVIVDLHPHNIDRPNNLEHVLAQEGKGYFDNETKTCSQTWLEDGTAIQFEPNYHYRLDFILNTLADSGFCLKRFIEPQYRVNFPTHMVLRVERCA